MRRLHRRRDRRRLRQLKETYGNLHILVHSVGFAPADDIKNDFLLTTREDFRIAHDISVYSLIAVARAADPLMTEGGSILTLTYYGSTKVFPNYNIMGVAKAALEATVRYLAASLGAKNIRVNAISAGPIKTLAARGIGDFTKILDAVDSAPPSTATSTNSKSATPPSSSPATSPAASPAKSPSSTAATTSPACK